MEFRISGTMVSCETVFYAYGNTEIRLSSGIMPSKELKLSPWTPRVTGRRS